MERKTKYAIGAIAAVVVVVFSAFMVLDFLNNGRSSSGDDNGELSIIASESEKVSSDSYGYTITVRNSGNSYTDGHILVNFYFNNGDVLTKSYDVGVNGKSESTVSMTIQVDETSSHYVIDRDETVEAW